MLKARKRTVSQIEVIRGKLGMSPLGFCRRVLSCVLALRRCYLEFGLMPTLALLGLNKAC